MSNITRAFGTTHGNNEAGGAGILVFICLLIKSCVGDTAEPVIGADLNSIKATYWSAAESSAFLSNILIVCTFRSLNPLELGNLGLDFTRLNFHSLANLQNSVLTNGMLSDINSAGMPCREKMDLQAVITASAVLFGNSTNSGYLEK